MSMTLSSMELDTLSLEDIVSDILKSLIRSYRLKKSFIGIINFPNTTTRNDLLNNMRRILHAKGLGVNLIDLDDQDEIFDNLTSDINILMGFHKKPESIKRLNWKREEIVASQYKIILLANPEEYVDLINRAPDFWAFKNKAYLASSSASQAESTAGIQIVYPLLKLSSNNVSEERVSAIKEIVDADIWEPSEQNIHLLLELIERLIARGAIDEAQRYTDKYSKSIASIGSDKINLAFEINESKILAAKREYSSAVRRIKKLIRRAEEVNIRIELEKTLSEIYLMMPNIQDSTLHLNRALKLCGQSSDSLLKFEVYSLMLYILKLKGVVNEGIKIYMQNIESFGQDKYYDALLLVCDAYISASLPAAAISLLDNMKDQVAGEHKVYREIILGNAYTSIDESDKAMQCSFNAIEQAKSIGSITLLIKTRLNLARMMTYLGSFENSKSELDSVIKVISDKDIESKAYYHVAMAEYYDKQGDYDSSINHYRYAYDITDDTRLSKLDIINSLVKSLLDSGKIDTAMQYSEIATDLSLKHYNPPANHLASLHLAMCYMESGFQEKALPILKKLKVYYSTAGSIYLSGIVEQCLGKCCSYAGKLSEAIHHFESAVVRFEKAGRDSIAVDVGFSAAVMKSQLGEYEDALKTLSKYARRATEIKSPELLIDSIWSLMLIHYNCGMLSKSYSMARYLTLLIDRAGVKGRFEDRTFRASEIMDSIAAKFNNRREFLHRHTEEEMIFECAEILGANFVLEVNEQIIEKGSYRA